MAPKIKMVEKILAYHHDYSTRLGWAKVPDQDWWIVSYQGRQIAEMWKGKSGWFGLIYTIRVDTREPTAKWLMDKSGRAIEMWICGAILNRKT